MRTHAPLPQRIIEASAHRVQRDGERFFEILAAAFVPATPQQAWAVLTDYERLPEFVPDLRSSRILSRGGGTTIVEQRSSAGFLFMTRELLMVLRIEEQWQSSLHVLLESGDMKHYRAHWELTPVLQDGIDGTHIALAAAIEPDFFLPPLVAASIVEHSVTQTVRAVVCEIMRRAAH